MLRDRIPIDSVRASGEMHDHAVFIKAISVSCGQAVPVGLLNDIFICFLGCLVGLAVFTEVVVVDLAAVPDHALEAGFFLDDAAVQPIGVRADIVNSSDVLLERTVRVKDAAGFLCRALGRQLMNAGGGIAGFGMQIIGLAVNFCPAGPLQLAVLVILPSKLVCEPAVPDLPLCIERHVACQLQNGAFVSIGGSSAICGSVPAGELVVLAREGIRVQRGIDADLKGLRRHLALAAIGVEGNRVEHTGRRRILRRVGDVLLRDGDLRAPAGEGVAILRVGRLVRAARKGGHRALQAVLLRDNHAIDHPCDVCAGLGNFRALFDQLAAGGAVFVTGIAGRRERRLDRTADLLGVSLCRDHLLRNKDLVADGAVLALGLAGFGAGRLHRRVDHLGVALCGNLLLRSDDLVADGAVLALGLAGLGAGRLYRRIDDLGVALGRNHFALGDFFAADFADCITGVAGLGAGGILLVDHLGERMIVLPLGIKSGVLGQINSRAIRMGVTSTIGRRIPVQEVVAFTSEGVCIQRRILLCSHSLRRHRTLDRVFYSSVGFKGNRQLSGFLAAPYAVDVADGVARLGGLRLGIGAVGVVQLGRRDGDVVLGRAAVILIRLGLRAGLALLVIDTGAVAGADVRTAGGGVDAADGGQRTVDVHLRIDKVCFCALIMLSGGI